MRFTPSANVMVTTVTSPSGMTDTAKLMAILTISITLKPHARPMPNTMRDSTAATMLRMMPSHISLRCRGVFPGLALASALEIWPTSVFRPVRTTMAVARPLATAVDMKAMFLRSPMGRLAVQIGSTFLLMGRLSPVSSVSIICRLAVSMRRRSAGTMFPSSRTTISPGTSSSDGSTCVVESRMTFACGTSKFCRACSVFSALYSCVNPMITFNTTTSTSAPAAM
mmetsp:Transcript_10854/g.27431  ORF Transcript_10854/g.27431 Transcript_10854/m.27431 type:complete len:225 (-) Transcript_10854:807-1481(-)